MKKTLLFATALLFASVFSFAQAKGPIVDKILFDAKTQEEIGLKDVAEGRSDFWNYTSSGAVFKALTDDVKNKLDVYTVTGVTTHSLLMNPYPNAAPYQVKPKDASGKVQFNPFAIREVRYAMNWLINRKKIVDEILVGAGQPMFNAVTPGQPNASKYGLLAGKLGMTGNGNEKKALADIDAAITKASQLPENSGKLVKNGPYWTFNGDPVTVQFLIRVDDPSMRLPEGRYISEEIEKAGIKVVRLEYDRAKCRAIWNNTDPATYQWNLYTEAWGGGQTYAFWESTISQMYAPNQSQMPGWGNAGWWQYANADADKLAGDALNGRVKDTADYYKKLFTVVNDGMKESVRIFLVSQTSYLAGNKDRFNARMAYGLGDGIDKWSWYTADVKPDADGQKVARMTSFSARGALFMSSWDPIGPDGFSDTYSSIINKEASDQEYEANPVTGIPIPLRASHTGLKTSVDFDNTGKMIGKIPVPADAVLWNAKTQKWESGLNYIDVKGDGSVYDYAKVPKNTSASTATFAFKFGKWHDGRAIDINDYRYALALPFDISVKKGDSDKVFEESYANVVNVNLPRTKGLKFNKDNTITVWSDANYPMDENSLAALMAPALTVSATNYGAVVPWEVLEAVKGIVAEGNASKTAYSYNSDSKFTEVDLLSEACVKDLRAKLVEFAAAKRVPGPLAGFVTPDQAAKDYQLVINFIDKHGHAYISNGGFMVDRYDAKNNTGALVAFRDPSYPYAKGYWTKELSTTFTRIDNLTVAPYKKGTDTKVAIQVTDVGYPSNVTSPSAKAKVVVTIVADKEYPFTAKASKAGSFEVMLPAKILDGFKAGSYTVVVETSLGTESPTVETSNVLVF